MGKERLTKQKLFASADIMRGAMEPSDYKHVALGLLFLRHISERFEKRYLELSTEELADPEDRDEYAADNIFWVPPEAFRSIFTFGGTLNTLQSDDRRGNASLDKAADNAQAYTEEVKQVLHKIMQTIEQSSVPEAMANV